MANLTMIQAITEALDQELARDEKLLPFFVSLGIDELSVSPSYVLKLRKQISEIDTNSVNIDNYINY